MSGVTVAVSLVNGCHQQGYCQCRYPVPTITATSVTSQCLLSPVPMSLVSVCFHCCSVTSQISAVTASVSLVNGCHQQCPVSLSASLSSVYNHCPNVNNLCLLSVSVSVVSVCHHSPIVTSQFYPSVLYCQ